MNICFSAFLAIILGMEGLASHSSPTMVDLEVVTASVTNMVPSLTPGTTPAPAPATAPAASTPQTKAAGDAPPVSIAEQVTRLTRAIEAGEAHLATLKAERDDPGSEYAQSQKAFDEADAAVAAQTRRTKELPADDQAALDAAKADLATLEKARSLAKERFDLAIEDRKVSGEQIANLEQKLKLDRTALDKLEGKDLPPPPAATPPATAPDAQAPATSPQPAPTATPSPSAQPASAPATTLAPAVPATAPATAPAPDTATTGTTVPVVAIVADPKKVPSKELIEAKQDAQEKATASVEAEAEAASVTERLANLDRDIALEQKLLATTRKQRDNATEIRRNLTGQFREKSMAGAPRGELDERLAQVREIEDRVKVASDAVHEHSQRLEVLQTERAGLQAEQLAAMSKAEDAKEEVKVAEAGIKRLENPFSPFNMLRWLIDHGPRMLMIVLAMIAGHWLSKFFTKRVIQLLSHNGARGSSIEREARARTLVGVCHNTASLAIFVGGGLMVLQEVGIPIAPLLGGAAVFGLAVAFGAQNLIRDYFYGFVILLENQYKLNDVVKIGDHSGQVEKITLRMTVLRDLEGQVHFLPNGQITAVTNMTHGWSRALFDIGVAYKENVDEVISVLMTLARELRNDPAFALMITEDATMLGVDALGDSAVVIKFFIKTRPLQQWNVKRELLRRIKNRFDELGIEIPYPQRTLHHRVEPGTNLPESLNSPSRILQGIHQAKTVA